MPFTIRRSRFPAMICLIMIISMNGWSARAGEPPATAAKPGEVVTTGPVIVCPSRQTLIDVYRMLGSGSAESAVLYANRQDCKELDKGVHLTLVEKSRSISRVLLSHFNGFLSASTDVFFAPNISLGLD